MNLRISLNGFNSQLAIALLFISYNCNLYLCYESVEEKSFYNLIINGENNFVVDKSSFINEYVRSGISVSKILRPKGWGKTTNLDMLRRFLEVEVDRNGEPVSRKYLINRKLFTGGEIRLAEGVMKILKPLKISTLELAMRHQGQYAVVYASFRNVTGRNYVELENKMIRLIADAFVERGYLKKFVLADREESEKFDAYCNASAIPAGANAANDIWHRFQFLGELLWRHIHRRPIYFLIDDYDVPVRNIFLKLLNEYKSISTVREPFHKAYNSNDFQETFRFFSDFFSRMFSVPGTRVLLTGEFDIAFDIANVNRHDSSILGNGACEFSVLDQTFFTSFGFTDYELFELLSSRKLDDSDMEKIVDTLKKWYGYNYRASFVYKPSSVARFLTTRRLYNRFLWSDNDPRNTSLVDYCLSSDRIQRLLQDLIDGGTIWKTIQHQLDFTSIADETAYDSILSYLVFSGYLQPIAYSSYTNEWELSIPNEENRNFLKARVFRWVNQKTGISVQNFRKLSELLASFKVEDFQQNLRTFLSMNTSPLDKTGHNGLMKCLTYFLEIDYWTDTNSEIETGSPNISLIAKREAKRNNCIVIEFATVDNPDQIQSETEAALHRLKIKSHGIRKQTLPHIEQILKVVLIFCDRRLNVDYQIFFNY